MEQQTKNGFSLWWAFKQFLSGFTPQKNPPGFSGICPGVSTLKRPHSDMIYYDTFSQVIQTHQATCCNSNKAVDCLPAVVAQRRSKLGADKLLRVKCRIFHVGNKRFLQITSRHSTKLEHLLYKMHNYEWWWLLLLLKNKIKVTLSHQRRCRGTEQN